MDVVEDGVHKELGFSAALLVQQLCHLPVGGIAGIEADGEPIKGFLLGHGDHLLAVEI